MGVPAFFRWLALRYPKIVVDCVEEVGWLTNGADVTIDASLPNPNGTEYDNLYLDMNGIIHPCTHPEDRPAPTTEEEMFAEVFRYCDRLINIVRPRKVLYMAIDGVAPRAKINQQRSRRFRSAKESGEKVDEDRRLREEWLAAGLELPEIDPSEKPFDSNVITPGTPFMDRLAVALRKYAAEQMRTNTAWRNLTVIFSDASVPGEGEHKIAEFIRQTRAQPCYNPDTRHVLYGLDADLIMLALATHEVHFTILREMVMNAQGKFLDKKEPPTKPVDKINTLDDGRELRGLLSELGGKTPFQFLHIHTLREYLDFEFRQPLEEGFRRVASEKRTAPVRYDFERVVDDFVFTCFFVGNDFLPHLPSLDIREGALEYLIELYKTAIPEIGYLSDGFGNIDFKKVRRLLEEVGATEDEVFRKRQENEKRDQRMQEQRREEKRKLGEEVPGREAKKVKMENKEQHERDEVLLGVKHHSRFKPEPKLAPGVNASNAQVADALRSARLSSTIALTEIRAKAEQKSEARDDAMIKLDKYQHLSAVDKLSQFKEALKDRLKEKATIESPTDVVRLGEAGWKQRYYESKFSWKFNSDDGRRQRQNLCQAYLEGLLWVMRYYYRGCVSWTWYFPYHYAPFASDLCEIEFNADGAHLELGEPFTPMEQLMSVLPPVSAKDVVPDVYFNLMVDPNSSIVSYYPEEFDVDLNGKRFAWQGVALLPFVDEALLLAALAPVKKHLSPEERRRDETGEALVLVHRSSRLGAHLELAYDGDTKADITGAHTSNGVVFGVAKQAPTAFQTGTMVAAEYTLPEPQSPHNPRPLPNATPPAQLISEAEFSYVRAGQTGWRVTKYGALGQAAKRLADSRRTFGASGYQNDRNPAPNPKWRKPPENRWGNRDARGEVHIPGFIPPLPMSSMNPESTAVTQGVGGGLAGPTAAALRRASGRGGGSGLSDPYDRSGNMNSDAWRYGSGGGGTYDHRGGRGHNDHRGGGGHYDHHRRGGGHHDYYRGGGGGYYDQHGGRQGHAAGYNGYGVQRDFRQEFDPRGGYSNQRQDNQRGHRGGHLQFTTRRGGSRGYYRGVGRHDGGQYR